MGGSPAIAGLYRCNGQLALMLLKSELPTSPLKFDALINSLLGYPLGADGLPVGFGGVQSNDCKIALIENSGRQDADIELLVATSNPGTARLDWQQPAEALAGAALHFAQHRGLLPGNASDNIKVWLPYEELLVQVNTAPTPATPASMISLSYRSCKDRKLLPTGSAIERLRAGDLGEVEVSLLRWGLPLVLLRASALGLSGRESLASLIKDKGLSQALAALSRQARSRFNADALDLLGDPDPVIAWVSKPQAYSNQYAHPVSADQTDLLVRTYRAGEFHVRPDHQVLLALGIACALPGTVANQVARTLPGIETRIGHFGGVDPVCAKLIESNEAGWLLEGVSINCRVRPLILGPVSFDH